jgi:hypothetical protein
VVNRNSRRAAEPRERFAGFASNHRPYRGRVKVSGQYDMGFDTCGPFVHSLHIFESEARPRKRTNLTSMDFLLTCNKSANSL